jgi:hypothetical protein
MRKIPHKMIVLLALGTATLSVPAKTAKEYKQAASKAESAEVLWRNPADIRSRNLMYGAGGKEHAPHGKMMFVKEDLDGTNPKFILHDSQGVKWQVKLGTEPRPEVAASRLVWAAGYFVNEDYFVKDLQMEDMPPRVRRGQSMIGPGGFVHNVRLKRYSQDEKKIGDWRWSDDPFRGTREYNALRTLMALINNWDLKDENNSVYEIKAPANGQPERIFMVSDLGASFGTTHLVRHNELTKGNLDDYRNTALIRRMQPGYVDFTTPQRPALVALVNPKQFFMRVRLDWIGRHIPVNDARWMGHLLAELSPSQIRDAFRAADYSPAEVEGFAAILENRIAQLSDLPPDRE